MRWAFLISVTICGIAASNPPRADLSASDSIAAQLSETSRTFSVGDLHGDVHAFYRICLGLRLCNEAFHWIGGDARLLLLGDLIDGAETSRRLIDASVRLNLEARRRGGSVNRLGGNHEMLAARGDGNYAENADALAFLSAISHFFTLDNALSPRRQALSVFAAAFSDPRSPYAQEIARRNTFLQVGARIFTHAGVHDLWPEEALKAELTVLNATVRREMRRLQRREKYSTESDEHWIVKADDFGPLWTRDLAYERIPDSAFTAFLERHHAKKMIVGHTSVPSGKPEPRYRGKLWLTDTKISSAYGGSLSALEFKGASTEPIVHTQFPAGIAPDVPLPCGAFFDSSVW